MQESIKNPFSFRVDEVKSLRDIAVESIREAIVMGYFKPGAQLKERDLSEKMGISTTPIKEALRILNSEGLVETKPRRGTFVSEMVDASIEEIITLKAYLEGLAARLAAIKITDEELEELSAIIDLIEENKKKNDATQLTVENTNFHLKIRHVMKNPIVHQMLMNVVAFDNAFRKRALQYQAEIEEGYIEHRKIYEAIRDRNPDLAELRMKTHILRTAENVLKNLNE